ncbi:cell division cycle and apoptosis regulator protein 1-like [Sabethes cyaneus]|uniref:cell division cycle and apoptosis regulator protein 1-like n=1 Tax=Sabethes cyaneus TaxID=53552 RepID=UPI00237D7A9E|nr:cell division cycle and apoptosis regulator protein 1-like [Sabethes cyaneus]
MAFNQKNPPWQRNAGQNITGMQALVSFPQTQPVFNQNIGLQQQQNLSLIPQMSLQQQQIYSQTVQYPASRPMNAIAFQGQTQSQSSQVGQSSSKFNPNQRVFSGTGHVTKVQNDFGFIDEEVFFHKNVCKGSFPKSGDRVLVEAAYNQNMPFKWNATRVQVLQPTTGSVGSTRLSYSSSQNASSDRSVRNRYSPTRKSPDRHLHRSSNHETRQRDIDNDGRRRRRDDRDVDRHRDKQRDRTPERKDRDRSPIRKLSPKRRKVRPAPRYMVQMPKQLLTLKNADILELRRRYHTLYIPSDFFTAQIRWVDAFPPNEPFTIRKPCLFHVMHKDVEPLHTNDNLTEPIDADYLYSAKVMLMSTPPIAEFYQKCFATGEERDRSDDDRDFLHPTRLINFLVGIRGKNETMAIGGPWSPSLDGENPHSDPNVLIKTAIRTCKLLTGIDLSNCSRWYRFVELYYRRSETYHKGHLIPSRVETVVIFLPDVRSCLPTQQEWEELHLSYKSHLERIVNIPCADSLHGTNSSPAVGTVSQTIDGADEKLASDANNDNLVGAANYTSNSPVAAAKFGNTENSEAVGLNDANEDTTTTTVPDNEKDDTIAVDADGLEKSEISNSPSLDVKKLKVADLKTELQARKLPIDGVKTVLADRLIKALQKEKRPDPVEPGDISTEKFCESNTDEKLDENIKIKQIEKNEEEEYETMDNVDMSEVTVIDEYDSTKSEEKSNDEVKKFDSYKHSEKERQLLEKRYSLPNQPHIIVHPSRIAKSGKFDCAVMSLSVLLDYRPEDSKEHSFEVSLFAELFNEMLTRDFGFNIFKALHIIPAKKNDDSKKEHTTDEKESLENKINGSEEKEREKCTDENLRCKDDDEKERNVDRDRDSRKRSRFDALDDDRRRKEKENVKDKVSYYTADRELLLSFVYFDVSHCGYIFDKDIEDLLYTLGLNLSRSQVRRVTAKALTRDMLYYRKLTDKVKESVVDKKADKDNSDNEQHKQLEDISNDLRENEISETVLKELATGNNNFLEQMQINLTALLKIDDDPPYKEIKMEPTPNDADVIPKTSNGLVVHNGAVLDIPKLLEQIRRSEKACEDAEVQLVDLRHENTDLLKTHGKANDKIKEQAADIKSYNRKLVDAEQNLREMTKRSNEYFSTLSSVYDRVSIIVHRTDAKRSSSSTSSKRGSSKDRFCRKERKSKDDEGTEKLKTEEKAIDSVGAELPIVCNESKDVASENLNTLKDPVISSDNQ